VKNLQHSFQDVDIVLNSFTTGDNLYIPDAKESVGITIGKIPKLLDALRICLGQILVEPELHAGLLSARTLDQISQDILLVPEYIFSEPYAVDELSRE
jgi:hypothetical protein